MMSSLSDHRKESKMLCQPETGVTKNRLKKFLVKVFYRAVCDYVNYKASDKPRERSIQEEAGKWLFDGGAETCKPGDDCPECWTYKELVSADRYMSFETICGILDWDIEWIRENVRRLTKSDLERIGKNGVL